MKNWYCKPASEAEAIEILERAVTNGARASDLVKGMSGGVERYYWNEYSHWGVLDGYTHANVAKRWGGAEQLTIQQVRERFPLPHEVKVMSKKEWQGPKDGLPPVGTVCSVFHRAQSETKPSLKICRIIELLPHRKIDDRTIASEAVVYLIDDETTREVGIAGSDSFFTLRTERDKWIERAADVVAKCFHDGGALPSMQLSDDDAMAYCTAIYDNMIKDAE